MAILWGGAGADTLTGGAEENTIGGGAGNDQLTGNSARDQIFGGDGNDTITGAGGDDYLEGGAGRDTFVLRPGDGWDYIGDFQAGTGGDLLDLTAWTGITNFDALLALATSDGNDTILTFSPTASVRLSGVARSALTAGNVALAAGGGPVGGDPVGGDPAGGTLSLGPATVSVAEGSGGGTTNVLFTVTRSGDVSTAASVNWSIAGSGASAAGAADFVGETLPSGVVTFAAGQGTATIAVPVRADTTVESDEGFTVTLSTPSAGWVIAAGGATGVIVNDDAAAGGGTPGQILTGTAARDELYGTAGNDTIVGGAGNDYMEGGAGSDRFVIDAGDGWDAIGDFQGGAGGDVLDLSGWTSLTDADAVIAAATQDSGGTVLNLSATTGVRLMGVAKASLTAANIRLGSAPQPPAGPAITAMGWTPAAFDATAVTRVNTATGGAQADQSASRGVMSADGRYVAFVSGATNLVDGDANGQSDLFLKDLQSGTLSRIALGVSGPPAFSDDGGTLLYSGVGGIHILDLGTGERTVVGIGSDNSARDIRLTADGRTLAYTNQPPPVPHASPVAQVVYRDMTTGTSTTIAGTGSFTNHPDTYSPLLSADGTWLAYSEAGILTLRNLRTGAQERLDGAAPGTSGGGTANDFSSDGRYALFTSDSSTLVGDDTNGASDVFVRDRLTGAISRVNTAADGSQANAASAGVAFGPDGRSVLFTSAASNLVAGDTNNAADLFLKDLQTGAVRRVSVAADGAQLTSGAAQAGMSADGKRVVFGTAADNLVAGDTNIADDLFVVDLDKLAADGQGTTGLVDLSLGFAAGDAAVTQATIAWGDGRTSTQSVAGGATGLTTAHRYAGTGTFAGSVTLTDASGASVSDGFTAQLAAAPQQTRLLNVAADGTPSAEESGAPVLSGDGRHAAFYGYGPDRTGAATRGVFVRNLQTGALTLVSAAADGTPGNQSGSPAALSRDGRYVVFTSASTNLVAGDTNGQTDVFVKDMQTGSIVRASTASDGTQGNNRSAFASISADGRFVAFASDANNLVAGDVNRSQDVFVKDLQTGSVERASVRADGGGGLSTGSGAVYPNSSAPKLSGDGRYLLFSSYASDLVPGGSGTSGATKGLFLKDRQTGALTQVNMAADGTALNVMNDIALSANGRYVAFSSYDDETGASSRNSNILVKDLQTGTVAMANLSAGGTQGDSGCYEVEVSDDGRYVAFTSDASNLVGGDVNGNGNDAFIKDMVTGEITRARGAGILPGSGKGITDNLSISGDGRYLVGESDIDGLVNGDSNRKQDAVLFDRLAPGANLAGGAGRDVLVGNALDDTLSGGGGDDFLAGGLGDDLLLGGAGNDALVGGTGDDTLTGGAGADVFSFGIGGGWDVVTDFNAAEGDRLQIGIGQGWTIETSGSDALVRFGAADGALLSGVRPDQVSAGWFITG
ncbi:beta strand repeat-containing protein [Azospirillum doebereinerae]